MNFPIYTGRSFRGYFNEYYKDVQHLKIYEDYCDTCSELKKDLHLSNTE